MNKVYKQSLTDLIENEKTTDLSIITYLSAIAMSKLDRETGYPTIRSFTVYKLFKAMRDNMDWINESSVYLSFDRLVDIGFFYYNKDTKKLLIMSSGSGHIKNHEHFKNKGYIRLHHFFFNRIFYRLSLVAKKIALIVVIRINSDSLDPENINFKSDKKPEIFEYYKRVLKINRLAHIKNAVHHIKEVGLFNISELEDNTIQFTFNTVSGALVVGTDKLVDFTLEQLSFKNFGRETICK